MSVHIVCTGREQHTRAMLHAGASAGDLPYDDADVFTFRCPRCGRTTQISLTKWPTLVAGCEAAGLERFDVSYYR